MTFLGIVAGMYIGIIAGCPASVGKWLATVAKSYRHNMKD